MALKCRRRCLRSIKILVTIGIFIFFIQLYLACKYIPVDNDLSYDNERQQAFNGNLGLPRSDYNEILPTKTEHEAGSDEPVAQRKSSEVHNLEKRKYYLRLEDLGFTPSCEITSKEAVSAIHRAKTQKCKQKIVNVTCLINSGNFYSEELKNDCPNGNLKWGRHLGCYRDDKKLRILSSHYGNYKTANTPQMCLDVCLQAGFPYAGVQYSSECFCGEDLPQPSSKVADTLCNMKCSGDPVHACGGYFTMNVYETGVAKFNPQMLHDSTSDAETGGVRIVFLLTLNGRALRQVRRLINSLYNAKHYFYIHVDARQDYLHRELSSLENEFPNIKLASKRFSTIWGGASLLQMLLTCMKDFFSLNWKWDFVINLSESDFPIKSLDQLENFLTANRGRNFVKSHGREVQRFIKKQGLDKTFIECDNHMWRIGDRKLPRGVIIDGGSDWIALSPEFVSYLVGPKDNLLHGLDSVFRNTLLPAESYFHTVLRNSRFCDTYVDNNLHVTNWKRKLGCKCQYKHVVDWCGCSPNDFRMEDWPRIQNTQDRNLFFARKFEPIINQAVITKVEQWIGVTDHYELSNIDAYWQSIYHKEDLVQPDDALLTHAYSVTRHNAKILLEEQCIVKPSGIVEISSYHYTDTYKGNLIMHNASIDGHEPSLVETWYKHRKYLQVNKYSKITNFIKEFSVSSNYDQKEQIFRNFGRILGPLTEPSLMYIFNPDIDQNISGNLSIIWLDPTGTIADVCDIHIDETNLTNFVKPNIKLPLLPGVWKVALAAINDLMAQTKFLITPLQFLSGKAISQQEIDIVHAGSQSSYQDFSSRGFHLPDFLPEKEEREQLSHMAYVNARRIGDDLVEWIDNLNIQIYDVLGSCVHSTLEKDFVCGRYNFVTCVTTIWSSVAPDPKGSIGNLNVNTGSLDRK